MSFPGALLSPDAATPEGLLAPGGKSAHRRYNVYRNNVTASLVAAMEDGFPAIRAELGARYFKALAAEFVRAHPPKDARLFTYGADFPAFLAGFPPLAAYPHLPDLARLELALRAAYHAADPAPFDPAALADPRASEARLTLAPACRILSSEHPIQARYALAIHGAPLTQAGAQVVLITRPAFDPMLDVIAPETARFIDRLAALPLGAAADVPGLDLGAALTLLIERHAIETLEFPA